MGRGGSRASRRYAGGDIDSRDILSTRDMITERHNDTMVDEVLTAARDIEKDYNYDLAGEYLIAEMRPDTPAIAYYDGSNIGVNNAYMDGPTLTKAYKQCVDSGFHPSNGNKTAMQAVAAHELGHALTDACGKKLEMTNFHKIADHIVNEARKGSGHRGVVQMAAKISTYATANNAEAIAEAVCDVYCNGAKAKGESHAIVRIMRKYL